MVRNDMPPPSDDEQPKSKKRKKGVKVASRGDLSGSVSSDDSIEKSMASHSPNYFGVGARAGLAIIQQRFTSNGTGALTNYEAQTNALGIMIGAGYQRAVHRYVNLGLDLSYAFAGAAGVKYHLNDPSTPDPVLAVQNHVIDGGARAALRFKVAGGLQLALRVGLHAEVNLIQPNTKVPLPSDIVMGMGIGIALDVPAMFYLAGKPFGLHAYGGGVVPANRAQTGGLEEGKASETFGAQLGGGFTYNVYKGLGLEAAYGYMFAATHFVGQARRNLTITSADRGSAEHLLTFGLYYNL
jgi:hypothetical protein